MITYMGQQTWLHRLPATAKLLALALLSLLTLPVQDWRYLCILLACVCTIYASVGRAGGLRLMRLARLWPMMALIAAFHLVYGDWQAALANVARLWAMIAFADLVTMSTTMQAMMRAIAPLAAPMRHVGLPPQNLTLAVSLMIRFVPLLLENWDARREAWRARGGGRVPLRLIAPFMIETLRMADRFAESLAARGFNSAAPEGALRRRDQ